MNMETKTRKNTDYSASAVNLVNPQSVRDLLTEFVGCQAQIDELKARLEAYPETQQIAKLAIDQVGIRNRLVSEIDTQGSYQDVAQGQYALKQRAVTVTYLPEAVHNHLQLAMVAAVIVESVDKGTVEALVKAGRISPQELELISAKTESYRYIIK